MKQHSYAVQVEWTGDTGEGTKTYRGYRRDHTIAFAGKPSIHGSSDPAFAGDPARHNPEELFVASLSACHMLWYLHLCSVNHISVREYRDAATGVMQERDDGSGVFTQVVLNPATVISPGDDAAKARSLHQDAHRMCFIANSVNFPVDVRPQIRHQGDHSQIDP